jgi:methyl-accepting chemotaxis protein
MLFERLILSFKDWKLSTKFQIFSSAVVMVCVMITASVCLWHVYRDVTQGAVATMEGRLRVMWEFVISKDTLMKEGGTDASATLSDRIRNAKIEVSDGKLMVGLYAVNDTYDIVDKIKELFGGTATIFMNDVRLSTNVLKPDGSRAIGTKLTGPAYEAVFTKGKPYRGEASVLGKPYFVAYDPIKNAKGEVIGALYVGEPRDTFFGSFHRVEIAAGVTALVLVGLFSLIVFFYSRATTKPLREGVEIANRLAGGDLTATFTGEGRDEMGQLLGAMRHMAERWRHVIGQVKTAADSMTSASHQLSTGADQMSKGSSVQAERASLVATSSEEMSQKVLDVAKNTGSISESAKATAKTARDGETVVNRAVSEVKEIAHTVNDSAGFVKSLGDRSNQIGEIVGVINDIADQTNLLALNAAIEAARAGEQGRGFAVVADEVRKLAERTAGATSEIGTMIKAIQGEVAKAVEVMAHATSKVDEGVKFSEEAGHSLGIIVKSVDGLQTMVQQIASAAEEMSTTSEQISRDIEQIATVSRETSGSSEQTARASTELAELSINLQGIVGEFKL